MALQLSLPAKGLSRAAAPHQSRPVRKGLYRIAFLVTALVAWWVSSTFFFEDLLPKVDDTLSEVWRLLTGSHFYEQMWLTTQRVVLGFTCAYVVALTLGIAMGRSRRVEAFFEMYVVIGMSQPGLFAAMIILVALGLESSTAIITLAYLATPIITTSVWQGAKNLNSDLAEVGHVFGFTWRQRVQHIILPQLTTAGLSALRQGLGITWKYVVMIEMIGLNNGVGYQVTRNFELFNLTGVVAWTICFMAFVLFIEYALILRLERRLFRWRDRPTWRVRGVTDPTHPIEAPIVAPAEVI